MPIHTPSAEHGPCFLDVSGPSGRPGQDAAPLPKFGPGNANGTDGSVTQRTGTLTEFAKLLDSNYTALLLHASENYYINQQNELAATQLIWLKSLIVPILLQNARNNAKIEYSAQNYRADVLLNQLSLNLDYFGQFTNSVPLLQINAYIDRVNDLLTYGRRIEQSYIAYKSALDKSTHDQEELNKTITAVTENTDSLNILLDDNVKQRGIKEAEISTLIDEINIVWEGLFTAELNFQRAVSKTMGGCSYDQIMTFASLVASLAASGSGASPYAAVGSAISAFKTLHKKDGKPLDLPDAFDSFKHKVSTLIEVGKDAKDFIDAANQLRAAMVNPPPPAGVPGVPSLPDTQALLLASAHDIETQVKTFKELPVARDYIAQIDTFVALCEAKNNKILEQNVLYQEWDYVKSQIVSNEVEINVLRNAISDLTDPRILRAKLFMENAYRNAISSIKKYLYGINRAYRYYSLASETISINDTSINSLETTKQTILNDYIDARGKSGSGPQVFTEKVGIKKYVSKQEFEAFRKGRPLPFAIGKYERAFDKIGYAMVSKISVEFGGHGAPLRDFKSVFTHHGRSLMLDSESKSFVFSHPSVDVLYEVDKEGRENVNGDFSGQFANDGSKAGLSAKELEYYGVSPYGPWTIELTDVDVSKRGKIDEIYITFSGICRIRRSA